MNVTLKQLRAFIAVARTGSFTLAAEQLFVTQSALSGLIKELELTLGVRLFDRSTRRIQLSDIGHPANRWCAAQPPDSCERPRHVGQGCAESLPVALRRSNHWSARR